MIDSRPIFYACVMLSATFSFAGCNRAQQTKDSIDAKIKREVPLGEGRQWVQNWVVQQEWKPNYIAQDKSRSGRPTIRVQVRLTTQNFPVTGDTFVEFVFDKQQKLQSYSTEELFTGP